MKRIYLLLLALATIFVACKKNREAELTTFSIESEKIASTTTTMELTCEVVCSATIKELYLQYSTNADFTKYEEVLMNEIGKSYYGVTIDNLTPNTTYYVRYLAENSYSSMLSDKVSKFNTQKTNKYTISVSSNNSLYGSVSGGGTYEEGTQVTLKATANSGYKFKEWNDGNTDNPRVITVTKDESYTAVFEKFEPEYVDLGLSVKWATCNVGATKPEEYGDYFAWGEVEPKEIYNWSTYKYCNGSSKALTKYCSHSSYGNNGFTDGKTILDPEDDAAIVNWGGAWRMPTDAELTELREKCKWTWTSQNDVNGYKVVGPNGNSIFLPAAGYKDGESLLITRSFGNYWSSSLHTDYSDLAYSVYFYSDVVDKYGSNRDHGRSVRPVFGERNTNKYTISVSSNNSSYGSVSGGGMYEEGTHVTLTATAKEGYKFTEWNDGNTDNPRVIIVTQDESYTAVFVEKTMKDGHEYVDLGLPSGLKWATCNIGSDRPEDYGDYFAWGEVEPKATYDWSTYKHCKGTSSTLTKYCNDSSYGNNGFTDNKTVLDPSDDAATVNWGGVWRMPTLEEQEELVNKCTWTWTNQNGVYGYKVVGPNGNSIFLPAAGFMFDSSHYSVGSNGVYWSSSLRTGNPGYAYHVLIYSGDVDRSSSYRRDGQSVRPVFGERDINNYTISASSNNSSYGSVSGGGTYAEGTEVTLTATANSGYQFKEWNDGNTDNPRVITVTKDESYTAIFVKNYTISASSNNSSYGSVSGGGIYAEGTRVTLKATANSGYKFTKWNDGNTINPRVITVTKNESYTAIFVKNYTISASSNNSSYGSVSGGGTYAEGTKVTLTATANSGYQFKEWNDGNTDNPRVITVTQDESYTAVFEKNYYTISVSSDNSSYGSVSGGGTYAEGTQVTLKATANSGYKFTKWNDGNTDNPRVITVTKDESYTAVFVEKTMIDGHEYVDLGLPSGLKWATCNVGATTPEDYGDYFAWGEVELKATYNWSTYKYCSSASKLTKYCNNSSYGNNGFTDNKTVLDPSDDAATVNWGGAWRMPTLEEQEELVNNCTWTWTNQNGVYGYKVVGPNGNSIFLPAAGYMDDSSLLGVGSDGYYWSSSLYTSDPVYAHLVDFYSSNVSGIYGGDRGIGQSVRPVCM